MSVLEYLKGFQWCNKDWSLPALSEEAEQILQHSRRHSEVEYSEELDHTMERSNTFPIPFPLDSVRLQALKTRRAVERLKENVSSTYPLVHERVLLLMARFLAYKREYGSNIEKELYRDMSVAGLVDRILKKRAIMFVGSYDTYLLITGEKGVDGWEVVGTPQQRPPLVLENCLSYDEMKLSAMVYVSGHTECINDGSRKNRGIVREEDIEKNAVIIGVIGTRFARRERLDYQDILITKEQNTNENGFGHNWTPGCLDKLWTKESRRGKRMWRRMWAEFYQVPCYTFNELNSSEKLDYMTHLTDEHYTDRYVAVASTNSSTVFDNEIYYKRLSIIADCALLEADYRAEVVGKEAYLNIIGAGLGVWKVAPHQNNVYVLSFLQRIQSLLQNGQLNHVTDVNFAYIYMKKDTVPEIFMKSDDKLKRLFLDCAAHPKGGISVTLENREPSTKLTGGHEGKLLVMTYPWDGNAHPGNEYWAGSLHTSGDPAAASSTQVAELHNAHVNLSVCGRNARVAGAHGVTSIQDYCTRRDNHKDIHIIKQ